MKAGDVLYFWGEDTGLMVVMANEKGIRYYDTKNPEFTDEGNVVTKFATYAQIDEVCSYAASMDDILDFTVNRSSVKLPTEVQQAMDHIKISWILDGGWNS